MDFRLIEDREEWIAAVESAGLTVRADDAGNLLFFRGNEPVALPAVVTLVDRLRRREIGTLRGENQQLVQRANQNTTLPPPAQPVPEVRDASVVHLRPRAPEAFDGSYDAVKVSNFVFAVRNYFSLATDTANRKPGWVVSFLSGPALTWYKAEERTNPNAFPDVETLLDRLEREFTPFDVDRTVLEKLHALVELPSRTSTYVNKFRELTLSLRQTDNNGPDLMRIFEEGLTKETFEYVRAQHCKTLRAMMLAALEAGQVQSHRQRSNRQYQVVRRQPEPQRPRQPVQNGAAPMEIGRVELHPPRTDEERAEFRRRGLCFRCCRSGHISRNCRNQPNTNFGTGQ